MEDKEREVREVKGVQKTEASEYCWLAEKLKKQFPTQPDSNTLSEWIAEEAAVPETAGIPAEIELFKEDKTENI